MNSQSSSMAVLISLHLGPFMHSSTFAESTDVLRFILFTDFQACAQIHPRIHAVVVTQYACQELHFVNQIIKHIRFQE